jgi:hypothetical protein
MKLKSIGKMFGVALLFALGVALLLASVALPFVVGIFWLYALSSLSILWVIVIKIAGVIMGFLGIIGFLLPFDDLSLNKLDKVLSTIFVALAVALAGFYLYNCSWIPLFAEVSTIRVVLAVITAFFLLAMIAVDFFAIWKPESFRAAMEESEKKEE